MGKCVISRDVARLGPLPRVCMCCGEPATVVTPKVFSWTPAWVYALLSLGPEFFLQASLATNQRMTVPMHFCDRHQTHFSIRSRFAGCGLLALLGALFLIITFLDDGTVTNYLLAELGVLAVVWFVILFANTKSAIQPIEINAHGGTFINVNETFTAALIEGAWDPTALSPSDWHDGRGRFGDHLTGEEASPGSHSSPLLRLIVIACLACFIQLLLGSCYGRDYDFSVALGTTLICLPVTTLVVFFLARSAGWSFLKLFLAVFIPSMILFLGILQKHSRMMTSRQELESKVTRWSMEHFSKICEESEAVLSQISDKDSPGEAVHKIERLVPSLGGAAHSLREAAERAEKDAEKVKQEIAVLLKQKAATLRAALAGAKGKIEPTDDFVQAVNRISFIVERMEKDELAK